MIGFTELVRPGVGWGPVSRFTLHGTAVAVTGAFVFWGLSTQSDGESIRRKGDLETQTDG